MKKMIKAFCILFVAVTLIACQTQEEPVRTLELVNISEIKSIEIPLGFEDIIHTEADYIQSFVELTQKATLTDLEPSTDLPTRENCTRIDIVANYELTSLFIFEEDGKWYIDVPNDGVYLTDQSIQDFMKAD